MNDSQLCALRAAAADGVACDGLSVSHDESGYIFETPGVNRAGLDETDFDALAAENPWFVSNWDYWNRLEGATKELLRWAERADEVGVRERYETLVTGLSREWGQLLVTAGLGDDGERTYELRHTADAGVEDLAIHDDPLDAREISTRDERGKYRPLKTAPTLRRGWVFGGLDGHDLVRTVEFFYPATVANWVREREGALDVTHFRETAERQTGIYDVVDELDVARGDGVFPCREPCSLVVAAARQWAIAESEGSRTYEFELTPSERSQVEAIIDAVADGRVDEIREADVADGANRYRARYLRAKRLDEEGRFDDVRESGPTDQ